MCAGTVLFGTKNKKDKKESMSSNTKTLTEGPLAKQILLVSLPLAFSNLLQVLFNMSDVAVVGRFAGSTALGAVGSTSILVSLFTGFLIGLSGGINVLVARFYGARHAGDVEKTVHSAAIVSLIAGVVLLFVGLLGSPFMLRLLNTKDDLLPGAILYLRVYFLGMPALALYNFGNAVFSAIGDTKKPLIYLSIAGALNILLNLFFVIVCQLSVVGVALASAISQCVSAGLILRALTRVQDCYVLDVHKLHLDPDLTRSILGLGLPAGFQNAIFAIANLFIQAGVNSFDSLMVKGNSAAANADAMIYDCMAAFYMACAKKLLHQSGLLLRCRPDPGREPVLLRAQLPCPVHHRERRHRRRHEACARDGPCLLHLRLYGLHHCRIPRTGQDDRTYHHRGNGLLRVPCHLGLHHLCPLPHHSLAVCAVPLQLGADRRRRDRVLRALLPGSHEDLPSPQSEAASRRSVTQEPAARGLPVLVVL